MDDVIEPHKTSDLSDSQPTKGNIAGGLTTIEEKAFGNLQKIGRKTKFIDVLKPAEEPTKGPGLYFMDSSSAAAECVTLQAAAGFVVHLFPTGQGNIIGNPIRSEEHTSELQSIMRISSAVFCLQKTKLTTIEAYNKHY